MHHPIAARRVSTAALIAALSAAALLYCLSALAPVARADGPGSGPAWTTSLGDSYISGEAGRWAGNTDESSSKTDALGSSAYYDNAGGTGESIKGCHRSKSAEVYIGGGVSGRTWPAREQRRRASPKAKPSSRESTSTTRVAKKARR